MARKRVPITDSNEQDTVHSSEVFEQPAQLEQPSVNPATTPAFKQFIVRHKNKLVVAVPFACLFIVMAFVLVDRSNLKKQVADLSNPQQQASKEAERLKTELDKVIELPPDESPTVATVVDASKVQGQSFFAKTQNGDKVLLFPKSGKAILYRESTKKIIEVAPINLGETQGVEQTNNQGSR